MARIRQGQSARPAAALIETAAVVTIFLMVLFGVFEYCRLLWVRQMIENAAREGARYAVVNTADPNLVANTNAVINYRMSGLQNALLNWKVQIFHADANGNPTYQFQTDSGGNNYVSDSSGNKTYLTYDSSNQQYYVTSGSNKIYVTLNTQNSTVTDNSGGTFATWASANNIGNVDPATNAAFGQYIAVQIDCDYNPIVPVLLWMNNTVHIQTKAFMCSEAN